jgi:hypothetical protein
VIVVVAGLLTWSLLDDSDEPAPRNETAGGVPAGAATTTLLFGTRTNNDGKEEVAWLALLSYNSNEGEGAAIYVPAHAAVEVPGRGLQGLTDAYETGGTPLLLVTTENLLGVPIDRYIQLSENDALALFGSTGPLTVNVPEPIRQSAGQDETRIIIAEGEQQLAPDEQVTLLYTVGLDGNDIELGSRHLAFWDALFDAKAGDTDSFEQELLDAQGALGKTGSSPEELADYLSSLAGVEATSRLLRSLPVTPLEVPGNQLFVTQPDETEELMEQAVGATLAASSDVRVQILNGNGVPGIGQEVAELLVGKGYRVILSGNAPRFDYKRTLIITYDSSAEGVAEANRAQELLGVGEVQVSAQEQGIVDLTIVVGKDFPRAP